jgi:hypothetical protein
MLPVCRRCIRLAATRSTTSEMKRYWSVSTILSAALTTVPTANAWAPPNQKCTIAQQRFFMSSSSSPQPNDSSNFKRGDSVQIEVLSFGPLGASVDIVGLGHSPDNLISETEPPLGKGLVLQKEIHYFRQGRNNVDVIKGEVLPAYVEKVREDGRMDIALRTPGGKAKAQEVGKLILERLEWAPDNKLPIGDKSSPEAIGEEFPGVSKGAFKKAVSALYKKGLVKPGPDSIQLMNKE